MKPISCGVLIAAAIVALCPTQSTAAQTVEHNVAFSRNDLALSKVAEYDLVEILGDKTSLAGEPGEPWLPVRDLHILIPPGTRAASLKAVVTSKIELAGVFRICPAQPQVPVSEARSSTFVEANPRAYASDVARPESAATLVDTTVVRGNHIAIVRVHPVAYVPATGKVTLRTEINLTLALELFAPPDAVRYKSAEPVFERIIREEVVNPKVGHKRPTTESAESAVDPNDVKYLLIGDADHFDEFQPLLDWKTKKGVPAEAVSVDWIYANYSGADNQEKIKACIRDYVQTKGTVWVVLAGDNTIVPDRNCYGTVGSYVSNTIPTDLYYAGLDDMDWDDDGDGTCAEVLEDTIDMGPDVIVGRLPIRTAAHATAIVNKILQYEKSPPATNFAEKMILTGARLWNDGDAEGKSEYMWSDWIDPDWDGMRWRLYDTATDFAGGAAYALSPDHLDEQLAIGYNFLHMATHGSNSSWAMESGGSYNSSRAGAAANPGLFTNIGTIACDSNAFDAADPCLSEAFIRNPTGGAVSYFGSSRYGWGITTLSTHGTSFRYDRMFYSFLFTGQPTTQTQHLGAVFTRMKEYWIGSCAWSGSMRWCQFSINLMGDPELCLYTRDPQTISPSYPPAIPAGPQTFSVDTGVPHSRVCLSKGAEVYTYGTADALGSFSAPIFPVTSGTLDVTITAPNYYPYEGTAWVVLSSVGVLTIEENVCSANDLLHINIVDLDLVGAGSQIVAMSTTGGDFETLSLTEVASNTGVFHGTMPTASGAPSLVDGYLQVADGETVTGTYSDADDGSGSPAIVQDTVTVDDRPPMISNVQIHSITKRSAIISFETDEVSTGSVRCGFAAGGPYPILGVDNTWGTTHTVYLDGLTSGTEYFFEVDAADDVGNIGTDDNGGSCYSFITMTNWTVPFFDDFESGNVDKWEINVGGWGDLPIVRTDTSPVAGLSPVSGANVAYLGDSTESGSSYATMDLVIDLAGLDWAELSFWWATAGLESNKYIRLDIWDGVWHENACNLAYNGTEWEYHGIDLSQFEMIDSFIIRFYTYQSTLESTDAAYVDDVRVIVPDTLRVTPREAFLSSGPEGGPFTPLSGAFTLKNIGSVPLDWTATAAAPWLDISPASGNSLDPGATTTVTLSPNATAVSLTAGIYPATVQFSNITSGFPQFREAELAVEQYATLPFFEDFEDSTPTLKNYWRITGTGDYRTTISTTYEPHGGLYHLAMDQADYDINYARNELTLGIDLAGYEMVKLSFWVKCFSADPQGPPPSPFINGADFDGVAVSEDGTTWYEVQGIRGCTWGEWEEFVVDLDSAVAARGLSYNSQFKIRFNLYGKYPLGSDGFAFDDIAIDGEVIDDMQVTPTDPLVAAGQEGGPFVPAGLSYVVANAGTGPLDWTANSTASWLDLVPASGTLAPGTSATVSVLFNSVADSLTTGIWSSAVHFVNTATGNSRWRDLQLNVSALHAPLAPRDPFPIDGEAAASVVPSLSWTCGTSALWNGGFESGDFRGWTPLAGPGWGGMPWNVLTSGTGMMGNNYPVEGLFYAQNGFEGNAGYSYQLYQDVGIPGVATTARLEWNERIQWENWGRLPAARRTFTVSVQSTDGTPLAILHTAEIDTATSGDTGYVNHSVDLLAAAPQIAGQVARIHFREDVPSDWPGWATFDLDGASLELDSPCPATFDVYFDTVNPPTTLIAANLSNPTCDPGPLADKTTYYWQVVAANAAGNVAGPVWSFTTHQPEIACTPTSLVIVCAEGAAPTTEVLSIWNLAAAGTMEYSVASTPTWLAVSPPNGSSAGGAPASHTIEIDPAGMNPGEYTAQVTVTAPGAVNNPVVVALTLRVTDAAPSATILSVPGAPLQPPLDNVSLTGAGADAAGSIVACEWWSDLDGLLCSADSFSSSSNRLTVGDHEIRFIVWDDEGSSTAISITLTVLNAEPSAAVVPGWPGAVAAGSTITFELTGQDHDEMGQSVVDGELVWAGSPLTGILPGQHALRAPATPGTYTYEYRVRDDEGAWSATVGGTLEVVNETSVRNWPLYR